MVKGISILGSTGSIGTSTLDVVRRNSDSFRVVALAAGGNIDLIKEQIREFSPEFVSVLDEECALEIKREFQVETGYGTDGASAAATYDGVDVTISAISGAAGLLPTLAAVKAGKRVGLANKETLVMAGPIVMAEAEKSGAVILPVDSEHSAVFQSLTGHSKSDVKRIILTASGGPFRKLSKEELAEVTPEAALKHPNWDMGAKVTIDSATLLNKGLEVIEARWLFDIAPDKIDVAIHPQSIVHSMVEYLDGSIISQMGSPDMRGPIAYALSYPERVDAGVEPLDALNMKLDFEPPDVERFPCLGLAYEALKIGGTMPAVLNAADEVAVEAFLKGRLSFTDIHRVIASVMEAHEAVPFPTIDEILSADEWAREMAGTIQGATV
ncbi:MAG: 1-deoxy-D-xylulose-5-phosphate reductoisomerase [Thermodesulfobacteriota bacterium]